MTQGKRKTWVIGHKNPDTDSICAAIAYADLKIKQRTVFLYRKSRTYERRDEVCPKIF